MRRMKIRATPNLGAGTGPRSNQGRSTPAPNAPATTVSSSSNQPSSVTTSTASVKSQENNVDSLAAEATPSDILVVTTHKPDSKPVIPDIKIAEELCASSDVLPDQPVKISNVAPKCPPSSSQIDTSSHSSLQNDARLLSNSSPGDDISQDGTSLQKKESPAPSPHPQTSTISASSISTPIPRGVLPPMSHMAKQTSIPPNKTLVETPHNSENKPAARRKKIRVMPMVGSSRKGSLAEKQGDKTANTHINEKLVVDNKVRSHQVPLQIVEDAACIVEVQKSRVQVEEGNRNEIIEVKAVTAAENECVPTEKQSHAASPAKVVCESKNGSLENKSPLVDKTPDLVVTDNETNVSTGERLSNGTTLERTLSEFSENNRNGMESSTTVTNANNKRRSKIRAKPMLLAKRKIVKRDNEEGSLKVNPDASVIQSPSEEPKSQASCGEVNKTDSFSGGKLNMSVKIEGNVTLKLSKCEDKAHKNLDAVVENSNNSLGVRSQRTKSDRLRIVREEPDGAETVDSNSDDSCGDKENSSSLVAVCRSTKNETREKDRSPTQKMKAKPARASLKKPLVKAEKRAKTSGDDSDERTEKQIFRERKEKYRKKISRGVLERSNMTMFDLIFWNPSSNPMPGRSEASRKKVRFSSETEGVVSDDADDPGLNAAPPQQRLGTPDEARPDPESDEKPPEDEEEEEEEVVENFLAPRVKIGPNGQIILDEQSVKIQTTAAKNRDAILSKAEVVEESSDTAHYGKWSKKRHRSNEWTLRETARFYKALSTVGTDFSLMETLFAWRSRSELKTKFKKEEKVNRELVDRALKDCTQFDFSLFDDESDYDPEEDRKATRMAERAEARRKRQEMKQSEKEQERKEKKVERKEEQGQIKERKALLRKEHKRLKKKVGENHDCKKESSCTEDQDRAQSDTEEKSLVESPEGVEKTLKKVVRPAKKRPLERRNSLVISEVTVTMETVNCEKPRQPSDEYIIERTIAEDSNADTETCKPFPLTTPHTDGAVPQIENTQKMWHFPVSAIQTQDDGRQTILVPTEEGQKSVPVPVLPLGTSNVVVVATGTPDSPGEHVYHVYVVSPQESAES